MKRILLTVHKFFPENKAGTEVLTLKVAQELIRRNYEVLIVTANPPDLDARHKGDKPFEVYDYQGLRVHRIGESMRLTAYDYDSEYYHHGISKHFKEILAEFKPDLVHIFHAQNLSASIIDASLDLGVPVILSATDFWFVCPIVQLKLPDGSVCRGPAKFSSNCLTCYTPHLIPPEKEFQGALAKRYPSLQKYLANHKKNMAKNFTFSHLFYGIYKMSKWPKAALSTMRRPKTLVSLANKTSAIMVPTKLMRDIFVENGIKPELIQHVPFGIDTAPLIPFRQKTPGEILRIGFIGTLFEHKGPDILIKAFQQLDQNVPAELKIYGNLEQFPEYSSYLKDLVLAKPAYSSKIEFCGSFANDLLGSVLQNLDVLVVPSRWYENTPLVIQSALATKTPLIVTNLGGMAELVKHKVNGLLFELNDYNSLSEQLRTLIYDRNLLNKLIENISDERTMQDMVDQIESVYKASNVSSGVSFRQDPASYYPA